MKYVRLAVALAICLLAPSITLAHTMQVFPDILHEGVPQLFVIMVEPPGQRPTVTVGGVNATVRNLLKGSIVEVTLPGSLLAAGDYEIDLFRAGEVLTTPITIGEPDFATLLDTLDGMSALVTQVVTDLATQADFFDALDSVKTQINLGSFDLAFDEAGEFFGLVNDSPEITFQQTSTLQDLTLFVGQLIAQEDPDGLKEKLQEKAVEKLKEKILQELLNATEKITEDAAEKLSGQIVGVITTISNLVNLQNSIKLKFAFKEVLKGGRRTVLETQLAILNFVNLLFNKAGISGTPFKDFAKLVAGINLSNDFAEQINKKAKAGIYTNLSKAMDATIKNEEAQLKKEKEGKKK